MKEKNNSSESSEETTKLNQFDAWVESWPSVRGRALTPTEQRVAYIAWFESTARQTAASQPEQGVGLTDPEIDALGKQYGMPMVTLSGEFPWAFKEKVRAFARAILARQTAPTLDSAPQGVEDIAKAAGFHVIGTKSGPQIRTGVGDWDTFDITDKLRRFAALLTAAPQQPVVERAAVPQGHDARLAYIRDSGDEALVEDVRHGRVSIQDAVIKVARSKHSSPSPASVVQEGEHCSLCHGKGKLEGGATCPHCDGSGKEPAQQTSAQVGPSPCACWPGRTCTRSANCAAALARKDAQP